MGSSSSVLNSWSLWCSPRLNPVRLAISWSIKGEHFEKCTTNSRKLQRSVLIRFESRILVWVRKSESGFHQLLTTKWNRETIWSYHYRWALISVLEDKSWTSHEVNKITKWRSNYNNTLNFLCLLSLTLFLTVNSTTKTTKIFKTRSFNWIKERRWALSSSCNITLLASKKKIEI